jgi:signal transduction histidine kinase/CheY-like chemotaxis protein
MRISLKLIIGYVLLASLISVAGYSAVRFSRNALQQSIGTSATAAASEVLDEIDKAIFARAQEWRVYSYSPLVQETLEVSNQRFARLDDLEGYLTRADREWTGTGPGETTSLMKQLIENPLARDLQAKLKSLELLSGYRVYGEVFLTNKYGANAAQTGRTSDFRQDDEAWWQWARDKGLYIADVQYDDSAEVFSTDICVRVENKAGQFVGVVKAVLNIQEVIQIVEDRSRHVRKEGHQHLTLLTRDKKVIYSTHEHVKPFSDATHLLAGLSDSKWGIVRTNWHKETEGVDVLSAYGVSGGHAEFEGFGWVLLAQYEAGEVLVPVYALRKRILVMSLGVNIVGVLLGLGLATSLSQRIKGLRRATVEIGRGNLDARVEGGSGDELGELAACFNAMGRDLRQARKEAEVADRAKTRFLANMSHEIRTPMTVILGGADMLLDGDISDQERTELLRAMSKTGRQLLSLIDDILDLSKIEASEVQIERIPTSPFEIVSDVIGLLRSRAERQGLQLEAEFQGPIPEQIETDPTRLRQVLINLVSNAIKFTERGYVRVSARLVVNENTTPTLQIEVADTGIGMSQTQLDQLFLPFTQADRSTRRRFGGTGLGLAISKQLSELLGGEITVRSQRGVGSSFRVIVPTGDFDGVRLVDSPEDAMVSFAGDELTSTKTRELYGRVLLVEDDALIRRLILMILEKAGADVSVACNGQDAVETALAARASGTPFDVVLMDLMMPVMDGLEATRCLRNSGYTGPIVALTADGMQETRDRCAEAGCDGYLTKPIQADELVDEVRNHVQS